MTQSSQWLTTCMILFSKASNIHTNSGVHSIGPSSLQLPCPSTNLAIHSCSLIGKEQKKISCISMYKYLSNHCYFINHRFMSCCTVNSWIFISNHSLIYFFVGLQWCGITHHFMQILVPTKKPFNGLVGPNPNSKLVFPNKTLHY